MLNNLLQPSRQGRGGGEQKSGREMLNNLLQPARQGRGGQSTIILDNEYLWILIVGSCNEVLTVLWSSY